MLEIILMKLKSLAAAVIGAGLCILPVSVDRSNGEGSSLSVKVQTANAAELAVPYEGARGRAYKRYRTAYYHPFCGGPYVGGGWNGGSYYGGPWMDLRCYGLLPW